MSAPIPSKSPALPTAVQWAQLTLSRRLKPGDIVVDATAGNGHDTLFLAQQVLPGGHVFGMDIQEQAVTSTRQRLMEHEVNEEGYTLIHSSHEFLEQRLPAPLKGGIHAFMFNLGYLPGGSKELITLLDSTLSALGQALEWLAEGGLLTVIAYPGHDGGREEGVAIEQRLASLDTNEFEVQKMAFLNFRPSTPYGMVVRKRKWLPAGRTAKQEPTATAG